MRRIFSAVLFILLVLGTCLPFTRRREANNQMLWM